MTAMDLSASQVESVAFTVNETPVTVRSDHPHLLAALREELNITSPKDGCSPTGQCGCCTVLVNGKAIVSCQTPLTKVAGSTVVTLEGVSEQERKTYAQAFAACGGLQCGFCIPGIVVRAKAQVDKKGAELSRGDMAKHLGAHLCRCTGYVKILDAIQMVARGEVPVMVKPGGVGSRTVKYEAEALALGDRGYIDDIRIPGMLHASLVFTQHTRADINAIDTAPALNMPGVRAVFTAADIPGELMVGIIYKDWPVMIPIGGRTSYAGDVLAIVIADTRDHARSATQQVAIDYTIHKPITDPVAALTNTQVAVWKTDNNVLSTSRYERGDASTALQNSEFVVEETFVTQRIEHAFLEPESTVAVPAADGKSLHVYSGGQGIWDDRNDIAKILNLENSQVTVELISNGGAFGGKEDMSNQAHSHAKKVS
jgi:aldehyde oxidoreductase